MAPNITKAAEQRYQIHENFQQSLTYPTITKSALKLFHLMKVYSAFFVARCQAITFWKMPLPPVSMTSP